MSFLKVLRTLIKKQNKIEFNFQLNKYRIKKGSKLTR
jgi:hypothetical protein